MNKYILAIDQGTTSTRAVLIDKNGNTVAMILANNGIVP